MQEIALCFSSPWEEYRAEYCSGLHQADTTSHPNPTRPIQTHGLISVAYPTK